MASLQRTRVLLVDRSPKALALIEAMLAGRREIEVVGVADSSHRALNLSGRLDPAVICLGLHLPVQEAREFLGRLLAQSPRPVLVVGFSGQRAFPPLLAAGAVDFAPLPHGERDHRFNLLAAGLCAKIGILSGVRVIPRVTGLGRTGRVPEADLHPSSKVVVIGSSTGGPGALRTVLGGLPPDFRLPVVCVQHIGAGFQRGLMAWLSAGCNLQLALAQEGELPRRGTVYFPPEGTHLEFDGRGRFHLSVLPPYHGHRPSVTVTMQSAARRYGRGAAGVVLTGMGDDGAEGLREISQAGGAAIVQDEESCVVFGMPKRAIELGAAQRVLALREIAGALAALGE